MAPTVRPRRGRRRSCANSLRSDVVSPRQNQCDGKSHQQEHDHKAQRPVWQFPRRKNGGTDLNDESRSDDVSARNAIDLSPLHLLEEAAHKRDKILTDVPSSKTAT